MIYLFGRCRLDLSSRALTRDNESVHLSPEGLSPPAAAHRTRPKVLTKTELMEELWPDAFVVEANLPVLVGEVRTATGDGGNGSPLIKTHHGVGYSFAAQTTEMGSFGATMRPATARGSCSTWWAGESCWSRHQPGRTRSRRQRPPE